MAYSLSLHLALSCFFAEVRSRRSGGALHFTHALGVMAEVWGPLAHAMGLPGRVAVKCPATSKGNCFDKATTLAKRCGMLPYYRDSHEPAPPPE